MNLYSSFGLLFLVNIFSTESAKILSIFVIRSRSHYSIIQPILQGLHAKHHEIISISHFKSEHTISNYTEILLSKEQQSFVDSVSIEDRVHFSGLLNEINLIDVLEKASCEDIFNLEYIKQLISSKEKMIDLIIAEVYNKQCLHLLAHKLDVPLVVVSPPSLQSGVDYLIGNPYNPAVTPLLLSSFTTKMNFLERLQNAFEYAVTYWYLSKVFNRDMEKYAREVFNMELPREEELNKRTALMLYNNHFSFMARTKCPNVIDIAGIHIKEPKKLPKDIEDFIEESVHGVIYFSFGSTIKASSISAENLKVINNVFANLPQRILWRVNELNITDVPPNVKLSNWVPQRDVLEHKNVIAFISHCGLFGVLEAIYTATPVVGMPIMFDQIQNAKILAEHGVGIYVDYYNLDEETLLDVIKEIVENKKYRENMQDLSNIFKNRPLSPLDEALYWLEYVLATKGARHMRVRAADMPLYQYLLLDVILFVSSIVICTVYLCTRLFKNIIPKVHRPKDKML